MAKKYGLTEPGVIQQGNFDFSLFLKTIMSGLTNSQQCSILVGESYREDVLDHILARINSFYPAYYDFFSKRENMTVLFNSMSEFIDPSICTSESEKTKQLKNVPRYGDILEGNCLPDTNRNNRLQRLMDSGLNQTEAENQLAQETGDNFRLLSQLQQLQDDLENVLAKNTEPPCKKLNQAMREDKGVEMMLDRTLNSIFNLIDRDWETII